MGVAAEPKSYTHALPGGRPRATVRVRPLLTGEILAPPAFFRRPGGACSVPRALLAPRRSWSPVPIPAFLVEHPGAGSVLVDAGLHASVAVSPADNLGPLGARLYHVRMRAEQAVPAQLEALGVDPLSVRAVVMTHLHYDHASGVSAFPEATFVVARAEWEAAASGGMLRGYRPRQFDHAFDWRAIDWSSPGLSSFAAFGRSVDLFDDGSVRLVSTPGHSPGHQSVVLRLHDRELLLTGDAAYRRQAITDGERPLLCADEHLYRRSLSEIRAYVERTPSAVVIYGHDPEGWAQLDEVYS
ncbi:MAG: N-acyl homoserine lactonase family protein [Solirubrobacteraceae bacterium]